MGGSNFNSKSIPFLVFSPIKISVPTLFVADSNLAATFTAYVTRRWTDAKHISPDDNSEDNSKSEA